MQAEENEKLQKNIDNERAKKERQAKKSKLDEEAARKKELLQIKRNNKARETVMSALRREKMTRNSSPHGFSASTVVNGAVLYVSQIYFLLHALRCTAVKHAFLMKFRGLKYKGIILIFQIVTNFFSI